MRKAIIAATLASLVFTAPAAHAGDWEGAAIAGGIIGTALLAGAIAASQHQPEPRVVYVDRQPRAQRHASMRAPVRVPARVAAKPAPTRHVAGGQIDHP
jgi:hypothetical protein